MNPTIEHQLEFAREKITALEQVNKKMEELLKEAIFLIYDNSRDYVNQMDFIKRVEELIS